MGGCNSSNNTISHELIGKTFRTTIPYIYHYYHTQSRGYFEREYDDYELATGFNTDLIILIKPPCEFVITDIIKRFGVLGMHIEIVVQVKPILWQNILTRYCSLWTIIDDIHHIAINRVDETFLITAPSIFLCDDTTFSEVDDVITYDTDIVII
jgi:hypothetical protein